MYRIDCEDLSERLLDFNRNRNDNICPHPHELKPFIVIVDPLLEFTKETQCVFPKKLHSPRSSQSTFRGAKMIK